MENTFIDTDGRKRRGILVKCKQCDKEFLTRRDQPSKYCSLDCSSLASRKRKLVSCAKCGKQIEKIVSKMRSKSGLYFCSRECKDQAQKLGGIKEIMPPHYGTASGKYTYRDLFENEEFVCARCGYKEFKLVVCIHHIDQDRTNNKKENLIPLCRNCHEALHNGLWKLETEGNP
jgi:hypothetical protein